MKACPCGSKKIYFDCCYLFIHGKTSATTPEALMRSRYTAYTEANVDYIEATMKGHPLENFNKKEAEEWAKSVQWLGLEVVRCQSKRNKNTVEFIARYQETGKEYRIHEISEFRLENGCWFYVGGIGY